MKHATLARTKSLLLAALRVWELKQGGHGTQLSKALSDKQLRGHIFIR